MHNNFISNLDAWSPIIAGTLGIIGYFVNFLTKRIKRILAFVRKVNYSQERINKMELAINEIRNELDHFISGLSNKFEDIQRSMMENQKILHEKIEKILILMVPRKE